MRILWLSHILPYPPNMGVLQRSFNLLKQTGKNHEVDLVSLNQGKILSTPEKVDESIDVLKNICRRIEVFPIPSEKTKFRWFLMTAGSYFSPLPYDVNWLRNNKMTKFLEGLSGQEEYDLIHIDTIGMVQYAFPFIGIPVVLNHHNIESQMMFRRSRNEKKILKKIYFRKESIKLKKMERQVCPQCSLNLVVSDLDGDRLKEIVGTENIAVVPNGVDTDYYLPEKSENQHEYGLIFVGPMDWYPNREAVFYFLEHIWPKLYKDNPDRRAIIIGKNPPPELIDACKNSKISAPGFVEDIRPYIDSAKIYICPIKDGGGTRLKILDALAMEKPLVATGLAVEGLDMVEEKHYLRAESGSEFVEQIKRLEDDGELCKKLALTGRNFVERRYSWKFIGKIINEAYQHSMQSKFK